MAPKDEQAQCVPSPGLSTLEATNAKHRILMKQGMTMLPRDGHCDRHGLFMICTEKIGEKTTSVMYRLDDAKDGFDSKVLSVWSREWYPGRALGTLRWRVPHQLPDEAPAAEVLRRHPSPV